MVLGWCAGVALFAPPLSGTSHAQDGPPKGRIRIRVAAEAEHTVFGQMASQAEVEESAKELQKRLKSSAWLQLVDRPGDADLTVTITRRRKDPDRGFVLGYIMTADKYRRADEFAVEGGTAITGGTRALGSDGRTNYDGRRAVSWDELTKQFTKSLEGFVKANYDRLRREREQR